MVENYSCKEYYYVKIVINLFDKIVEVHFDVLLSVVYKYIIFIDKYI